MGALGERISWLQPERTRILCFGSCSSSLLSGYPPPNLGVCINSLLRGQISSGVRVTEHVVKRNHQRGRHHEVLCAVDLFLSIMPMASLRLSVGIAYSPGPETFCH